LPVGEIRYYGAQDGAGEHILPVVFKKIDQIKTL
jgi:hypothetical protein